MCARRNPIRLKVIGRERSKKKTKKFGRLAMFFFILSRFSFCFNYTKIFFVFFSYFHFRSSCGELHRRSFQYEKKNKLYFISHFFHSRIDFAQSVRSRHSDQTVFNIPLNFNLTLSISHIIIRACNKTPKDCMFDRFTVSAPPLDGTQQMFHCAIPCRSVKEQSDSYCSKRLEVIN